MGHGTGQGRRRRRQVAIPDITIVNGGAKAVYFYVVLKTPARVQKPYRRDDHQAQDAPGAARSDASRSRATCRSSPASRCASQGFHVNAGSVGARTGSRHLCPPDRKWKYHVEGRYSSGQVVQPTAPSPAGARRRCSAQCTTGSGAIAPRPRRLGGARRRRRVPGALGQSDHLTGGGFEVPGSASERVESEVRAASRSTARPTSWARCWSRPRARPERLPRRVGRAGRGGRVRRREVELVPQLSEAGLYFARTNPAGRWSSR